MNKPRLFSSESKKPKFFYGYVIVLAGFLFLVITHGVMFSFGVFLKPVAAEFDWTRATTSGAYSLSIFLLGFLFMVTGRLTDRFGPRIVMTVCGLLLALGLLLMSQLSALWQLYLFYGVIVAMGLSGSFVPITSTVSRWFAKRRGMMVGIVLSGISAGTMIMPPVASHLIASYGWRTSYFVVGITALVLLMLAAQFLKRDPGKIGQLPDGESEIKQEGSIPQVRGFSLREAIHTKQFWILCATQLLFGFFGQTIMVHIVPDATDMGISAIVAANILAIIGGISILGRIGIGTVADRIGARPSFITGLIIISISLSWLLLTRELWMFCLFAVIFGFGYGGAGTLAPSLVAELFGMTAHGTILGIVTFAWAVGSAVGPAVAGHIFDISGSYFGAFVGCVILSITCLILASLLKPTAGKFDVKTQQR